MSKVKQSPSSERAYRGKNGLTSSGKVLKTNVEAPVKNGLNGSAKGKYKTGTAPLQPNGLTGKVTIQKGGYMRVYQTIY